MRNNSIYRISFYPPYKKYGEEKITMEGQSYYYIASELLP